MFGNGGQQIFSSQKFGYAIIHSRGQAFIPIAFQRIGSHGFSEMAPCYCKFAQSA